jgi:hypothetical protein
MTNDFRFALEDEVRDLERQTRIREEEIATAARAAQMPVPAPSPAPEGAVPREEPVVAESAPAEPASPEPQNEASPSPHADAGTSQPPAAEAVSVPHEKSSDDNAAV